MWSFELHRLISVHGKYARHNLLYLIYFWNHLELGCGVLGVSPLPPNKIDLNDVTEILIIVMLNTHNSIFKLIPMSFNYQTDKNMLYTLYYPHSICSPSFLYWIYMLKHLIRVLNEYLTASWRISLYQICVCYSRPITVRIHILWWYRFCTRSNSLVRIL